MKRILQNAALVIVAIVVVIGVATYFLKSDPDNNIDTGHPTVVDASGNTYAVVLNEQGTTYVVVTDAEQNRFMAEYDGVTAGSTGAQINNDIQISDLPTSYTGPSVSVSQNGSDYAGEVVTSMQIVPTTTVPVTDPNNPGTGTTAPTLGTTVQSQPTTATPTTSNTVQEYKIHKYEKILESGTYIMTVDMNDPDMPEPVTFAIKNGNIYMKTSMPLEEGKDPLKVAIIYNKQKDEMFMAMEDFKVFCKMPEELLGDMDIDSMSSTLQINVGENITVSQADINGKTLSVESYVSGDGDTISYYFDGESLVRMDSVSPSGVTTTMLYSYFSGDVPDSYFEKPDGYMSVNLSFLQALM